MASVKPGKNDLCSCGSGKKYKRCCMGKVALRPPMPSVEELNQLIALFNAGRLIEVESRTRLLVERYPESGFTWKLLGATLHRLGKDALAALKKAAKLLPNDAEAHYNLGVTQKSLGQLDAAVASYRRAIELKPDSADAYNNLGHALQDLGQFDGAQVAYRRALELNPNYVGAHYNLGNVLRDIGRLDDAIASCRRALEIQPDFVEARSNLLFSLNYTASHDSSYCLAEAREFGLRASKKVTSRFSTWECADQPERLKVGIVSGDLRNHPVGYALKSLLEHLDAENIELIAYSTNPKIDAFTVLLKPYFAAWKPLYNLNDEAAARLIHADGVHVLLDLSGHTEHNRLPMFAWKPAPVQASWLGYFATTGVAEMDYLLMSEAAVPQAHQKHFTETIWYLPDTWICFTPPEITLPVTSLPALQNGHLTFGCFQRLDKLGDAVLAAWANILTALPGAKLRMACRQLGDQAVVAEFSARLRQHGIDIARVTMQGPALSRDEYLARYAEVDVMLDSFPYPGVTTTCEALWMGVPTLTIAGDTLLARQGAGVLAAAGMNEWIANGVADYTAKAVALAGDVPRLATLRSVLRERVGTSPLYDAKRFAKNFEAALWGMYQAKSSSIAPNTLNASA
ncbi:MAG: tetratricopeptide repeat protein [Nitrosomonadales bacterium]|nr:tetratricopeptide repeat protein [Nitrosomonadales bacterium]